MKITHSCLLVTVVVPVEVGGFKASVEVQVCKGSNSPSFDLAWVDYEGTPTFMGVEISDLRRFEEFFKSMGLNLNSEVEKQYRAILTEDVMKGIIGDGIFIIK